MKSILAILALVSTTFAADTREHKPNPSTIRIIPVRPTPEPDNVEIYLTFPKRNQMALGRNVQFRVSGFPVGNISEFERRREIYDDPEGQSIRVIIDNFPAFDMYKTSITNYLDDSKIFYDQNLEAAIPYRLDQGDHYIRAFPVRSFGESLKGDRSFISSRFYYGGTEQEMNVDLSGPLFTYNEPSERHSYREGEPILIDFYVSNVQLSKDGYKVRISIDNSINRILTMWIPYYLYGLKKGTHTIRMQLIDEKNAVEPGDFNNVEKTIRVY